MKTVLLKLTTVLTTVLPVAVLSINNLINLPIPQCRFRSSCRSSHTLKPPLQVLPHRHKHQCILVSTLSSLVQNCTLMAQSACYIRHCYQSWSLPDIALPFIRTTCHFNYCNCAIEPSFNIALHLFIFIFVFLVFFIDTNIIGAVNGPLKNEKSRQILPKSQNLAQLTNGSRSLRFCVCRSHICFSIKSLNFSVLVSDFKMPVSASLGFTIRHPLLCVNINWNFS